jgi:glycerol uptake facilitator-like aquaporin
MKNRGFVEFLAEFLGTFVFICFGLGAVAQSVLYGNQSNFAVSIAFSLGLTFGIIIAGNISGTCNLFK